jgi:hypothetical protein
MYAGKQFKVATRFTDERIEGDKIILKYISRWGYVYKIMRKNGSSFRLAPIHRTRLEAYPVQAFTYLPDSPCVKHRNQRLYQSGRTLRCYNHPPVVRHSESPTMAIQHTKPLDAFSLLACDVRYTMLKVYESLRRDIHYVKCLRWLAT